MIETDMVAGNKTPELGTIRERIMDVIVREGMIDRDKLTGTATLEDLGVQSLDMVIMLNAFEDEFDVYVPIDQTMTDVKNVDQLVAAIENLIANPVPIPHTITKS